MRISDWSSDVCSSDLFAWFENAGIGVALPSSPSGETSKVGDWIAADTGRQRPWLCGFSNGAAMAASLLLSNPGAYSGLVMSGGCFAVEDGDLPDNGLPEQPVLFCRRSAEHTSGLLT